MHYTPMAVPARASVTVPQLNGGVNVYDTPDMVADNQLTECDNLWWHKGALRTRPGLRTAAGTVIDFTHQQAVNERETLMLAVKEFENHQVLYAGHLSVQTGFAAFAQGSGYYGTLPTDGAAHSAIGFRTLAKEERDWYFLTSGGDMIAGGEGQDWVSAQPYIPTVLINGKGQEATDEGEASVYEDYNMLTRAFKCQYTTDGVSHTWPLPLRNLAEGEDGRTWAVVELTVHGVPQGGTAEATTTYTATLREDAISGRIAGGVTLSASEVGTGPDGAAVEVEAVLSPEKGTLTFWGTVIHNGQPQAPIVLTLPRVANNNLTITAWRNMDMDEERLTICRMTRCTWFGGDRSGLGGGTRLFLTGNPENPGLVHWSGVEHPLYFPEGNYAYVGERGQAATGFGKQGDLLVMFSEHSMAAAQYVAGDDDGYAYAESGGVAATTYMAHFPITQLNASVGCDCPDTVRLVNNRLVWADSTGRVYMLISTNAYSERNVRLISRNIQERLAAHGAAALKQAVAGELGGYYLLLVENCLYLLDTQNSAFSSFNYYSNEDGARKALPWYIWTLPSHLTYTGMVSDDDTVRLVATSQETGKGVTLLLEGTTDDGVPVTSRFATKRFTFNRPDHKKSIEQLYVGVGLAPGGTARVGYHTERGAWTDPYEITDRGIQATDEELPLQIRLTPHVRMAQQFGLSVESDSPLTVGSILIKAKQQGVVR